MAAETSGDKKGILLETGTNEFEIVEFSIGKVHYGINVAKVLEIIRMPKENPVNQHLQLTDAAGASLCRRALHVARQGDSARQSAALPQRADG